MNAVELFIADLEDEKIKAITEALHFLIIEKIPQIEASIKYRVPFYKYYKNLCYLNPRKDHVDFGFIYGILLSNEQGILEKENRKQIMHINVYSLEEVYQDAVTEVILEAALINEENFKHK